MSIGKYCQGRTLIALSLFLVCGITDLGLSFAQMQEIKVPGATEGRPMVGIHQVFDYGFDMPLDSCKGGPFLAKVIFDPLPELNRRSHVRVKLKACYNSEREVTTGVFGTLWSMECSQTTKKILTPGISQGQTYEWDISVRPRDIGVYKLMLALDGGQFTYYFAFDESRNLVYLDRILDTSFNPLPNHPAVNDKEIIMYGKNKFFKNVFRIIPPPCLSETSVVHYKITALSNYPKGVRILRPPSRFWQGPVRSGDVYEGSFTLVPRTAGRHTNSLLVREAAHPLEPGAERYAIFNIFYILDQEGKLKFIADYELKDEPILEKNE